MERDKLQKCELLIEEMMKHGTADTEINGVNVFIQLEQAIQLKRLANALEAIDAEVDRKARWIRPPGL
jgi:hypothetical protein